MYISTFAAPFNREKCHAWSVGCLTFLIGWEGPSCETEASPERTSVMSKKITTTTPPTEKYNKEQGWHKNTDLGCDIKTLLRSDVRMKTGKEYQGVFRLDSEAIVDEFLCRDPHYTFVETVPLTAGKRNQHVYNGQFITVTRRDDGSLRLNFKQLKTGAGFKVERYALGVFNEICVALEGLIER